MTRTRPNINVTVSKSVDDLLDKYDDNKSALVDSILKAALVDNPTAVDYIIANRNEVPWGRVLSKGLESIVDEIRKQQATSEYVNYFVKAESQTKPHPIKFLVREAIANGIRDFDELVKYVEENGRQVNYVPTQNFGLPDTHYRNQWILAQTNGEYRVNFRGEVEKY